MHGAGRGGVRFVGDRDLAVNRSAAHKNKSPASLPGFCVQYETTSGQEVAQIVPAIRQEKSGANVSSAPLEFRKLDPTKSPDAVTTQDFWVGSARCASRGS